MRFAFSTLGCPGLALDNVVKLAASSGFAGVELRASPGEPVTVDMDAVARRSATAVLADAGISALSVAAYVKVADPDADDDAVIRDGLAHGRLAAEIGAAVLRVFPGGRSGSGGDTRATDRLARIAAGLSDSGVTVALETHDSHPTASDVRRIIDPCPGVQAIWDVLHTWRAGEPAAASADLLAGRLAYVQVKDVIAPDDLTPVAPGDGQLPLDAVAAALRAIDYDGWISWEYERAWYPAAPSLPGLAPRVASYLHTTFGSVRH